MSKRERICSFHYDEANRKYGAEPYEIGDELVRCKECRHKYQEPWHNGVKVEGECEIWHNATLDDDFCSYGERSKR